jgi:hypothetical protein
MINIMFRGFDYEALIVIFAASDGKILVITA